jgi:hypothetical protein
MLFEDVTICTHSYSLIRFNYFKYQNWLNFLCECAYGINDKFSVLFVINYFYRTPS